MGAWSEGGREKERERGGGGAAAPSARPVKLHCTSSPPPKVPVGSDWLGLSHVASTCGRAASLSLRLQRT